MLFRNFSSLLIKQYKQNVPPKRIQSLVQTRFSKVTSDTMNSKYMEKYYSKLKIKAEKENFSSVEELKAEKLKAIQRNSSNKSIPIRKEISSDKNKTNSSEVTMSLPPHVKPLDKILNMDKIKDQDSETIEKLWLEYHSTKNCLSAVIPADTYRTLFERGQQYPMFVVPLLHEQGLEFHILQFQFHQCFFTSLLEYKTHGTESRHHMVLTHFPDLINLKGIVLMYGEIVQPNSVSLKSAQYLAYAMQKFYVSGTKNELDLVERFHKHPNKFEYSDLIKTNV